MQRNCCNIVQARARFLIIACDVNADKILRISFKTTNACICVDALGALINAWKKMQHYLIWWTQLVSKRFCASHHPQDLTNSPCMERVFHCGRRSAAAYRWSSPQTEGQPAGNVWKRWPPCSENGEMDMKHVQEMRRCVSSSRMSLSDWRLWLREKLFPLTRGKCWRRQGVYPSFFLLFFGLPQRGKWFWPAQLTTTSAPDSLKQQADKTANNQRGYHHHHHHPKSFTSLSVLE